VVVAEVTSINQANVREALVREADRAEALRRLRRRRGVWHHATVRKGEQE
jgi:hypothetical protein